MPLCLIMEHQASCRSDIPETGHALSPWYCIEGCDGKFWTEWLLRQILTEERVGVELRANHGFSRFDVSYYLDLILAQPTEERPETLKCFQGWNWDQKQTFAQNQWRLIFPFLGVAADENPRPIVLEHDIIKPWRDSGIESNMGMFETVSCLEIHPTAHSFEKILSNVSRCVLRW